MSRTLLLHQITFYDTMVDLPKPTEDTPSSRGGIPKSGYRVEMYFTPVVTIIHQIEATCHPITSHRNKQNLSGRGLET